MRRHRRHPRVSAAQRHPEQNSHSPDAGRTEPDETVQASVVTTVDTEPRVSLAMTNKNRATGGTRVTSSERRAIPETYDTLVAELRELRESVGQPSFAEIARRIAAHRMDNGVEEFAAMPARTTVYDAFKLGRSRMDPMLISEIARALGEPENNAAQWKHRAEQACSAKRLSTLKPENSPTPTPAPQPELNRSRPNSWPPRTKLVMVALCVVLNLVGHGIVAHFPLPLYLDMVGTAIAAITLGPWYGVAVAFGSQSLDVLVNGNSSLSFLAVNVVGALVWGFGARRLMRAGSLTRFFGLSVVAGIACSLVATPIIVGFYGGGTGHSGDELVRSLETLGSPVFVSVLSGNLLTSIMDKLLAGFIGLVVYSRLNASQREEGTEETATRWFRTRTQIATAWPRALAANNSVSA